MLTSRGVKPQSFEYVAARELDHAVATLAEHGEDAKVLAGGQSLVPLLALRLASPPVLVDINRAAGLDTVEVAPGWVSIGATVRHRAFERGEAAGLVPGPLGALLARVGRHIGHPPIRNRGTFVGSLAHGDPRAEWALLAVTLGARVVLVSAAGSRELAVEDFLGGPFAPDCRAEELLVRARLPVLAPGTGTGFSERSRTGGAFMTAAVCAVLTCEPGGTVATARVAAAGPLSRPTRLAEVEAALLGRRAGEPGLAAAVAQELVVPPSAEMAAPVATRLFTALCADAVGQGLEAAA